MITPKQAADIVNYLSDAGAMTIGSDGQGLVWADYLNDPDVGVPDAPPTDLLPAARQCLKVWASEGRSWRVDLPRYAQALKRVRADRLRNYKQQHGALDPTDPRVTEDGSRYVAWKKAVSAAIGSGLTDPHEIQAHAYKAVGLEPPHPEITETFDVRRLVEEGASSWQ